MTKRFPDAAADDKNEARPEGAGNADEPLKQSEPVEEVTHMPFDPDYGDSAPKDKTEQFGLTQRQRECLMFLRDFQDKTGLSPSFQEIMEHLGLRSKSGVHRLVNALREKGHISALNGRARSIRVETSGPSVNEAIACVLSSCTLTSQTKAELRAILEAENIQRFDPPWNVIGRKRGIHAL